MLIFAVCCFPGEGYSEADLDRAIDTLTKNHGTYLKPRNKDVDVYDEINGSRDNTLRSIKSLSSQYHLKVDGREVTSGEEGFIYLFKNIFIQGRLVNNKVLQHYKLKYDKIDTIWQKYIY